MTIASDQPRPRHRRPLAQLWISARARPRLLLSVGVGLLTGLALSLMGGEMLPRPVTRLIAAWNAGAWLYLGLAGWMMCHATPEQIVRRARREDEGARTILALVVIAALCSLGAIVAELGSARDLHGAERVAHIALAVATLVSSWAFTQLMFALHYAHDYHLARQHGRPPGLDFPGTDEPDYLDFLYFAVVIGTSGQTADIAFSSRAMRRIGMVHCVLAFVFNTSLIGLMINVASGLI
ncbi:MAG: hypothetical protein RLZZ592_143 [Pseudomonadota bacterium]|jgi:uncharacterized membrane protein